MKRLLFVVAMAVVAAVMVSPASAQTGMFSGTASVAQGSGTCGVGNGWGLGLPGLNQNKIGSYRFTTNTVIDVAKGIGTLDVCGQLTSVAGIGAACGMSKGYNGIGTLAFNNGNVNLSDVGWKFSATGKLPVIGTASGKENGTLLGLAWVEGGAPCLTKSAKAFTVIGVYTILPFDVSWNDLTDPIDPKNDGQSSLTNIWGDKK